ncbi:MAG TPA: glycosyltransferase family 39 protein [Candidatus Acidoferrales bacterium]
MHNLSKYEKILTLLFLLSLPFVNPWVRGDGVGYYAFARAPLIEHSLDFRNDWARANSSFRMARFDVQSDGKSLDSSQYSATGHLNNHFSVGAALLWAPFLVATQSVVMTIDHFGGAIAADGFSRPYVVAMALGTAVYGFLALWISFRLARRFVSEEWAFVGTLGIWFASSLPVYMYFNPSWSHAQSAFVVALFLWYWLRTLGHRNVLQWLNLGLIAGLMMDVYYINVVLLLLPAGESVAAYYSDLKRSNGKRAAEMLLRNLVFSAALITAFLPTLVTKKIIYGSPLNFGYTERWFWNSPAFFKVAFSADHGFFVWTPVLILAIAGVGILARRTRIGLWLLSVFAVYVYAIGCYQDWDGISSFGNRFFVSLTPIFVIGLAIFFQWLATLVRAKTARLAVGLATAVLIAVNLGLMFQWGMHLIPPRGPISFRAAARNEVAVVPSMAAGVMRSYFTRRSGMMKQIEQEDVKQLKYSESSDLP